MLPVGQLPDDFNGVPVDGEQYLAMVRREAENQPRVFYSTEYVRCTGEAAVAPASSDAFMPSFEWRALFLTRFGRLQETYPRLPDVDDEGAWYRYIHGRAPPSADERKQMLAGGGASVRDPGASPADAYDDQPDTLHESYGFQFRAPTMAMLARLDTPYFVAPNHHRTALHPIHSQWLFALHARLDPRLAGEEMASLRALARACMASIGHVRKHAPREPASEYTRLHREAGAWMILTIVAGAWGQHDLWGEALARTTP